MKIACERRQVEDAASALPLPFLFFGDVIDNLRLTPDRDGGQEERTEVTEHAGMAPHDLKKEEKAHFITPSLRSGQV